MAEQPNPKPEREIDLEQELIDEAFEIGVELGSPIVLEKKILAVAFLLQACTGYGNESLDGHIADGLAGVLRNAAKDAARLGQRLRRQDES